MKKFILENNITIENGYINYISFYTRKNIKKEFNVKLSTIHQKMKEMDYVNEYNSCNKRISEEIENYAMMPFAYVYYYYFAENLNIPSPKEFVDKYFELFCEKKGDKYTFKEEYVIADKNIVFEYDDLKGRILRSYNSFNREIEFLLNVLNNCKDFKIKYNLYTDLFDGVDLSIDYNNNHFGVAEYVSTKRSKSFKSRKNNTRHDYSDLNMIDIVAVFGGEHRNVVKYGEIFCYNNNTLKYLVNKIKHFDENNK